MFKNISLVIIFVITGIAASYAAGHTVTISSTAVSCNGLCDGSASATVSGGVGPYGYQWSPVNATTPGVSNLCAGTYTCTVTDFNDMSTSSATVTIFEPAALVASGSATAATCNSLCNGTISVSSSGGTAPYAYNWDGGITCQATSCSSICAGSYSYTVTDFKGCTVTGTVVVPEPAPLTVSLSASNVNCAGTCDGILQAVPSGGTTPYTYSWNLLSQCQSIQCQQVCPGTYTCTVTDAANCQTTASITVSQPSPIVVSNTVVPAGCNSSDGSVTLSVTGGYSPYSAQWSSSANTTLTEGNLPAGNYSATVFDAKNCQSSTVSIALGDSCDFVWPGDANDDGIANNVDILDIGLAYGVTGPLRANASLVWKGQPSLPWSTSFSDSTNHKFADCNGDGIVNDDDTVAVTVNYGYSHNRVPAPASVLNAAELKANILNDTIMAGSLVEVAIELGSTNSPVADAYGIAFSLSFDPALVDPSSFSMNTGNSWMGTQGGKLLAIIFDDKASTGTVDVAVTKTDHISSGGSGTIAVVTFRIPDTLSSTSPLSSFQISVSKELMVNDAGTVTPVVSSGDTTVLIDTTVTTSVRPVRGSYVSVFPNPVKDILTIRVPAEEAGLSLVTITNSLGSIIYQDTMDQQVTIDMSEVSPGVYYYQLGSPLCTRHGKFFVAR